MKSVAEAESAVLAAFAPVGVERCGLLSAHGRYLAEPLIARDDTPPFDNSAMDGYALHAADLSALGPSASLELEVVGESRAGDAPQGPLARGTTMRIFTGAPMPPTADCVELQENTQKGPFGALFSRALRAGENVRLRGTDVREGELLLGVGARLGAAEIALLAGQNYASVPVFVQPRVAIVATGDELRDIGEPARPGSIVNSNAYMLAAQVVEAGAIPWVLPVARDERSAVAALLRMALRADVVVLSGGVSVGDYDVVRDALDDVGIALDFWKVNMKPGKPLAFAREGAVPVLGLPGNPASSFLSFELFARPGLRRMLGDPTPQRPLVTALLEADITRRPGRTEFIRARLASREGVLYVTPLSQQNSGSVRSIAEATALVEIAADLEFVAAGTSVRVRLVGEMPRELPQH